MATGECQVVSGTFALVVQGILAIMVIVTLLAKRFKEEPKRSWQIWFMDTSKQAFAMSLQHLVNIWLAVFFAHEDMQAGECIWYITNFTITVACGLFILTMYMRFHSSCIEPRCPKLKSGQYSSPGGGIDYCAWVLQLLLWGCVCCAEKFITAGLVIFPLRHAIDYFIAFVEMPMKPYPKAELVLIMAIMPACENALFAWIVDNLIKRPARDAEAYQTVLASPRLENIGVDPPGDHCTCFGCLAKPTSMGS